MNRLEDTDSLKNAFEISSPLIERILAICQGPSEANKWVELINNANKSLPIGIKRQLSNLSNSSIAGSAGGSAPPPPMHVSIGLLPIKDVKDVALTVLKQL